MTSNKKILVELSVYVLFTWLALYLFSTLGLSMMNLFDINTYVNLFQEKILSFFLLLFCIGIATSILFIALRQLEEKHWKYGLISSIIAVLPAFLIFNNMLVYSFIAVFYVLGVLFVSYKIAEHPEDTTLHSFGIGWSSVRKVFYVTAVGVFLGSLIFVSGNQDHFKSEFKDLISESIEKQETFSMSKDQVRDMVSDMEMSRDEIRNMVESTTPRLTTDQFIDINYPDYDNYSEEEKAAIKQQVNNYLNSDEYIQNRQDTIDEQVESIYSNMDEMQEDYVDEIHQKMNSEDYRSKVASSAKGMMDSMPIVNKVMSYMPVIIAITLFTLFIIAELVASFVAGLVFMLHFWIFHEWLMSDI